MDWWWIIKSSRGEAYSAFLEEFGPEVDLRSLEVESFLDDPENANTEYYLSVSNTSDEIMGHWVIQSNGYNIRFASNKYSQYQVFVEGMFKEEYPERYQEIVHMLMKTLSESNTKDLEGVPVALYGVEAKKWLRNHEFYVVNSDFDMSDKRNSKSVLKAVIEYYEDIPYRDANRYLQNVYEEIGDFTDLYHTFASWAFVISGIGSLPRTWDRLKDITSMVSLARAINLGVLDDTEQMRIWAPFPSPVRIRKIWEMED